MSAPLATEWPKDAVIYVPGEEQSSSRTLPPIRSAKELLSDPPRKPPEIIEGLLHQGCKMVLGGASKSNKTWVLVDLAISISTGKPWWEFPTVQGPVLYLNFELPEAFFAERIKLVALAKGLKLSKPSGGLVASANDVDPPEALDVWNLRGYATDFENLEAEITRMVARKYALICLDPTYKLLGDRDENRAGDVASLLNGFERLAVETGAGIAFGAHFSKGNQAAKESMDRIGGSGVFARDPDTILTVTRHQEDNAFTVEPILRNHPPIAPFVIRWDFPLMKRDNELDPAKLKQPKFGPESKYKVEDLVTQLAAQPRKARRKKAKGIVGLKTGEFQRRVCEEIGMSRGKFYELLKEGKKQGRFEKRRDKWQLVQKVQEVQSDTRTDQ
jgi:hypothetical protein